MVTADRNPWRFCSHSRIRSGNQAEKSSESARVDDRRVRGRHAPAPFAAAIRRGGGPTRRAFPTAPAGDRWRARPPAIVGQTGNSMGTARHDTTRHGRLAVPCLLVPPCRGTGPGTTLSGLSRAVPYHWARRPSSDRAGTGTISVQHLKLIRISGTITSSSQS